MSDKLKPEFSSSNEEMRRVVKRVQKGAGDFPDKADVSVLNDISRLEHLRAETHGISNAILEIERLETQIRRLSLRAHNLEVKLRKINGLSSGWDGEE